ncbi:unnamed protein product [Withania somnifera]
MIVDSRHGKRRCYYEGALNHPATEKEANKPILDDGSVKTKVSSQMNLVSTPDVSQEANTFYFAFQYEKSQVDTNNEPGKENYLGEGTSSSSLANKNEIDQQKMSSLSGKKPDCVKVDLRSPPETKINLKEVAYEEEAEPVFDGTEEPGIGVNRSLSARSVHRDSEAQGSVWPEKAVALTNFVRSKSSVVIGTVLRRLSGKSDDEKVVTAEEAKSKCNEKNDIASQEHEMQPVSQKPAERPGWNPLSSIGILRDDTGNKLVEKVSPEAVSPIAMKGRIILYTRLGCQESREERFLHCKRLRYIEINIDVYPSRKLELEKVAGDSVVPRVFFNEVLIGGWSELKSLDESGKLSEKIEYVVDEAPSFEAPLPPLSDELAVIVKKMTESITLKDRFYKLRRFTNCFLGSEAVDFLSEDQYLERDECQNIPRGLTEVKPKLIMEISSRLRFLSHTIFEAYASEDGRHVDYRSIHGSEEFARYLRITEELQRVNLKDMPREEKLTFFINLYNMVAIHAILVWGHPSGSMQRKKLFGEFKYVIGGCTPPYNLINPFGVKDQRLKTFVWAVICSSPSDIHLIPIQMFRVDFGKNEVEVLKHAVNYLESLVSQALLELLANSQLKVVYQPYDWGLNH